MNEIVQETKHKNRNIEYIYKQEFNFATLLKMQQFVTQSWGRNLIKTPQGWCLSKQIIMVRNCLHSYNNFKTIKQYFRTYCTLLQLLKHYISSALCSLRQLPCFSPREEGINCLNILFTFYFCLFIDKNYFLTV